MWSWTERVQPQVDFTIKTFSIVKTFWTVWTLKLQKNNDLLESFTLLVITLNMTNYNN